MRSMIIAAAAVSGLATGAHADIIGSAPAFGGQSQAVAICYYNQAGTRSITFNSSQIFVEPGQALGKSSDDCSRAITPAARCRTVANIPNNAAVWCRAEVSNGRSIRGRLEIRSSGGSVLTTQRIR